MSKDRERRDETIHTGITKLERAERIAEWMKLSLAQVAKHRKAADQATPSFRRYRRAAARCARNPAGKAGRPHLLANDKGPISKAASGRRSPQ